MSETKWTPAPWGVTTRHGSWDWVVYTEADPNIEICQPFHDGTDDNEIGEANARLIAAAPDLYEALESVVEAWGRNTSLASPRAQAVIADARAALARARGEP